MQLNPYINQIFSLLQPYCKAIYLGGSYTQKYINHPHDIDYICIAATIRDQLYLSIALQAIKYHYPQFNIQNEDWIQLRNEESEEHAIGSYIYKDMQLLVGEKINFKFDILGKDKEEYISLLKSYKIKNEKRYYQLYRGYLLVSKGNYNLTSDEINELNLLHDCIATDELKQKVINCIKSL